MTFCCGLPKIDHEMCILPGKMTENWVHFRNWRLMAASVFHGGPNKVPTIPVVFQQAETASATPLGVATPKT